MRGEVIPLRPLTLAERLDAAVELLRRNALGLLCAAAVLAVVEQALLYPLRALADVSPPWYFDPYLHHPGFYWLLVATGFGTESAIITVLGGVAARVAVPALTGQGTAPKWPVGRAARLGGLAVLALVIGLGGLLTAAAGLLPWIFWYMFTGLAGPSLVIERRGPFAALGHGIVMVHRGGWRPAGNRLLGYLAWYFIRLALAFGGVAALLFVARLYEVPGRAWVYAASITAWVIVNTVAYAVLGCFDAVLHLENRMRVEGLDIALARTLRRGAPADRILVGGR
jgi:hypothetical protein